MSVFFLIILFMLLFIPEYIQVFDMDKSKMDIFMDITKWNIFHIKFENIFCTKNSYVSVLNTLAFNIL